MRTTLEMAKNILYRHTHGFMSSNQYEPQDNEELLDTMTMECSYILTEELLNGHMTPMQYNDVRNCLAQMLWDAFRNPIESDESKKRKARISEIEEV